MTNLLEFREQLKAIYSKYEVYLTPLFKFLLALLAIVVINSRLGYMSALNNAAVVLILALMCSFLPMNLMIVVAAAVTLGHLYALSMECAIVALAVYLLLFILYFRFSPADTIAVLLTPIFFAWGIPYVMPIAVGLVSSPASAVAVASGVIVYYMLYGMNASAAALGAFDADSMVEKFRYVVDNLIDDKTMLVTIVAFAATVVAVWIIRRLSVDHAWTIAMITGALLDILILLFGDLMYSTDSSVIGILFGSLISVLLVKVLEFFVFNVDYTRTEYVQFEDDEYYYYVKAVPKNTVAAPEKRVKTIRVPDKAVNPPRRDRDRQ